MQNKRLQHSQSSATLSKLMTNRYGSLNNTVCDNRLFCRQKMVQSIQITQIKKCYKQKMRQNQLTILELRNTILKQNVQIKSLKQQNRELQNLIKKMKHEREKSSKNTRKMLWKLYNQNRSTLTCDQNQEQIQNKMHIANKIQHLKYLSPAKFQFRSPQQKTKQAPRDRYETCIRQLDMLKCSLDEQNSCIGKQRDFYKQIYQQVKSLVFHTVNENKLAQPLGPKQLMNSLVTFFTQLKQFTDSETKNSQNSEFKVC